MAGRLTHCESHLLSKNNDKTVDALSYRVLLILPVLYRRWATTRLHDLRPWIRQWQLEGMYAGIENVGAEDAWYDTALHLEYYYTTNYHIDDHHSHDGPSDKADPPFGSREPGRPL